MFYALNENVYLVKGYAKSCIYDFNSLRLYSINKKLSEEIELVNYGKIVFGSTNKILKKIFDELLEKRIFVLSKEPKPHEITEMNQPDTNCDFAWIEITKKCNLQCRHCYNESDGISNSVMSLHNYKIVVDSLLDLGVKKIQIIGGEPFLNPSLLKEMLAYTVSKFKYIEIFTNGTLVPDDWMEFLQQNDIHMALSIYSYQKKIHDSVTRCNGSWEKTNHTIRKLKKHNVSYRICNVLMKDVSIGNKTTNLYELSDKRDIVRMSGRANFSLLSDDLIRKKLIRREQFSHFLKKDFSCLAVSGHNCFGNKIYISANMEVYPCVMEGRVMHCIVEEGNGIHLNEFIRRLNKDKINGCRHCEYRYTCYDCRANSLSESLLEKPWYCTYDPMKGEWEDAEIFLKKLKQKWTD